MAERTLRLIFENSQVPDKTVTITVPLADDTKSPESIKDAMDVIRANRGIFTLDIGDPKAAAFVTPMQLDWVDIAGLYCFRAHFDVLIHSS